MIRSQAQGVALMSFSSAFFVLSAYISNIFLGRYLGPHLYGAYGVVIALWSTVSLLLTAGISQAVSKFVSSQTANSDEVLKKGLYLQAVLILIVSILYFTLAPSIASLLKDLSLIPYIRLSTLIFPFYSFYSLYLSYYNGLHRFGKQATMGILYSLSKVILIVAFAYFYKLNGALVGTIIAPIIPLLVGLYLPKSATDKHSFKYKRLIAFSIPIIGFMLFTNLFMSVDLFLVKLFLEDSDTGFYNASLNISRIPYYALSAFSTVIFPSISKSLGENDLKKTSQTIRKSTKFLLMILIPATLLISATSTSLIKLIYSSTYLPAASPLMIHVIGLGFLTLFTLLANILNGGGYPKMSVLISAMGVLCTVIAGFILIPILGMIGGALATTFGALIAVTASAVLVLKKFGTFIELKSVYKITVSSLIIYIIAYTLKIPFIIVPLEYLILAGLYLGILFITKELSKTDLLEIYSVIPFRKLFANKLKYEKQ